VYQDLQSSQMQLKSKQNYKGPLKERELEDILQANVNVHK